jgi:hypothetical protein
MSHNPMGLHNLLQGQLYLFLIRGMKLGEGGRNVLVTFKWQSHKEKTDIYIFCYVLHYLISRNNPNELLIYNVTDSSVASSKFKQHKTNSVALVRE